MGLRGMMLGVLAACAAAAPACAADLFSSDTVTLIGDVRLSGVDAEKSFVTGRFGKTRFGSSDGDFRLSAKPTEATLVWQPRFGWALSGTVVAAAQAGQDHAIDLIEAFVAFKPLSGGTIKVSGRAGVFWPPVSLEHSGADWRVTETITPSAINSWIGEEVKVGGIEGSVSAEVGGHRVIATAAAFELNDTAGTLLAFRGWALSDFKATAFGHIKVPPMDGFMRGVQSRTSRQLIELDDKVGFYGKIDWRPPAPFAVSLFYYDNRGDPEAVRRLQWGWDTRFWNLGLLWKPVEGLTLTAQGMTGNTRMGFPGRGGVIWVDTDYWSAFVMATRAVGSGSVSLRGEAFGTRNHGSELTSDDDEDGWAVTAAWRRPLTGGTALKLEAVHVDSERGARVRSGLAPHQRQTLVQAALRVVL